MLVGEVALYATLVDEVGEDAGGLVIVHVLHLHHLEGRREGLDGEKTGYIVTPYIFNVTPTLPPSRMTT